MAVKVDRFEGNAFRGLVVCPIPIDGKSVVILGENGFGKSSIVDGFEFFFTGHIDRFEGTQGLSVRDSVTHATHQPADAQISITFNPGSLKLTRTLASSPSADGEVAAVLRAGEQAPFILRRSQLLEYIVAKPAERYDKLARLIGIDGLEERELALKSAKDHFEGRLKAAELEDETSRKSLEEALGVSSVDSEARLLSSLNELRRRAGLPAADSLTSLTDDSQLAAMVGASEKLGSGVDRASQALAKLPNDVDVAQVGAAFAGLVSAGAAYTARVAESQLTMLELLRKGRAQLEYFSPEACPLCEQPISRVDLTASIDRRISELDRLSTEASRFRTEKSTATTEAEGLAGRFGDAARLLGDTPDAQEAVRALSAAEVRVRTAIERIRTADLGLSLPAIEDFEAISRESLEASALAKRYCDSTIQASRDERTQAFVSLVRALEALRRHRVSVASLRIGRAAAEIATKVLGHFSEVRSAAVDAVYAQILPDLQRYYGSLHPDELHKDVVLRTIQTKRKSAALEITSFSRSGRDPRLFSSEAHLDTLGLCIFLAFYKKCSNGFPLLVLDDVLTTVDSQHRMKVAELLLKEFSDRQLVLTTHDYVWFEELKQRVNAERLGGSFTFLNIVGWSVDGGPEFREVRPTWDRIEGYLATGEKNAAGNETRRYLEWVLEEICIRCRAPIPYSYPNRPSLEELFNGSQKRLSTLVKDSGKKQDFDAAFADVAATKFMSNILSHNNPQIGDLTAAEVRMLASYVKALDMSLRCGGCQSLLIYSDKSNELCCPDSECGNRSSYPTKK